MPKPSTYIEKRNAELILRTREMLKDMPEICGEFNRSLITKNLPLTRYSYLLDVKLFCEYLVSEVHAFSGRSVCDLTTADFEDVTASDLRAYVEYLTYYRKNDNERENGDSGLQRKLSSLRIFYSFMFKAELIASDVTKLVDLPKRREKPIVRLEIEEVARMLDSIENGEHLSKRQKVYQQHTRLRDLAIVTLFLGTGIRVSELVGLDIEDLDFGVNGFTVTRKGGKQTILYFPNEVADTLKQYLAVRINLEAREGHEHALFLSLQNKRIAVRSVQVLVKKYAEPIAPLKKHLSPHKLRSTFGTNLYHETGDIYLVADLLGHSDVNTTRKHYAAMSDDLRREAVRHIQLRDGKEKNE